MADFFNNKDYNEYFEKLNSRHEQNSVTENKPTNRVEPTRYTGPTVRKSKSRKKGFYKVFRLNLAKIFSALAILLVLVLVISLCAKGCKGEKTPVKSVTSASSVLSEENEVESLKTAFTTTEKTKKIPQSLTDAKSAVIIRKSDNTVVAQRNMHKRIFPASTLKVMTLIVAVENITDMDATFTMTYAVTDPLYVEEASVAGFLDGEKVTMTDLLYGMILPSGADAAMGLALSVAGSEEEFVRLMNEKAKELGLENTHFTNVSGLHNENNYSTAYDMAIILDYAMRNETCRKVLETYQHTTRKTKQNPDGILLQSTLFSYMYGTEPETATILGGKTGYVNEAGYCIASFGKNIAKTEEYIVVTMGNSSRWPAFYGQIDLYKKYAK